MNNDARDYLKTELEFFNKAYEIQFDHFMRVFYFWTVIVTAPISAGLLTISNPLESDVFQLLLMLIAIMGWFLSAKMFDIRCSQLRYVSIMNEVRELFYRDAKNSLPKSYEHPLPAARDLRQEAMTDFGIWMAFTMSFLDAVFFAFAVPYFLSVGPEFNWRAFVVYFLFGISTYFYLVSRRVPKPRIVD